MVLEIDGQADGQIWTQSRRWRKTLGYVVLVLRLYSKEKVKDIYSFSVFRFEYSFGRNFWALLWLLQNANSFFLFLVFNWNVNLLTNNYSIHICLPKCSFRTVRIHIEIDHKTVRDHSKTKIIDESVCHSYSESTFHRCSTEKVFLKIV